MKKFISILVLILFTKLGFVQGLNNYTEDALISIDRTMYITGESINFSVSIWSNHQVMSKILYVELIKPDGKQIIGKKFIVSDSKCSGEILIPENLQTGNYYIRAYTKFMRNRNPYTYGYQFIKIINPYSNDIQNNFSTNSDSIRLESIYTQQNGFKIGMNDSVYSVREDVKIEVTKVLQEPMRNVNLTVVPSNTIDTKRPISIEEQVITNKFIPETRGITLTGILKNKQNNEPSSGKRINLTILEKEKNSFYSVYSNSDGNFYFALPDIKGRRDLFLSAEKREDITYELLIDNDFCSKDIALPNPDFRLTSKEKEVAYKMAINCKVRDHFMKTELRKQRDSVKIQQDTIPFYGDPTHVLNIDNYVALPTLEDYFTEISFYAGIRTINGVKQFKIFGEHPELRIYDPLIMVDLIPVNNVEEILKASPEDISRFEVVATPYVYGNIMYGGILNIVSRENDMARIKLPDTGVFLNYMFIEENKNGIYKIPESKNVPDARNTLYWNPDLKFKDNQTTSVVVQTADMKGSYTICLTGVSESGKIISSTLNFNVE